MKKIIFMSVFFLAALFFYYQAEAVEAKNYQQCMDEAETAKRMRDDETAMKYLEEAMRYRNEDAKALYQIGKIYDERGDIREAKEYYEKALARSYDAEMTYEIGSFYMKIGDLTTAEDVFTKAWRRKVNSIEANLGMGDYNLVIKNYRKAAEFYQFVVERDQTKHNAYFRYAICLDALDKKEKALEMCEKAMKIENSEEIRSYYNYLKKKR